MTIDAKKKRKPLTIGWRETVAFPDWKIKGVQAKVDTGANTSAIHVEDIIRLKGNRVRFYVVTNKRAPFRHVLVTSDITRTTRIRSSTGHVQERYVVTTRIKIGDVRKKIELSLVRRDKMLCRMLLGRKALEGLLVDVTKRNTLSELKLREKD